VSSPPFAAGDFFVSWRGSDAGGSGLESYDIQVREGAGGTWTTWLDDVDASVTQATYTGASAGQTLFFRSVARDALANVETPPGEGDTSTQVTAYAFKGHVFNNQEAPVFMAQGQLEPAPATLGVVPSGLEGAYGLFFDDAGDYQLTVQRSGFGTLPSRRESSGVVSGLDFYLPPVKDFIVDGDFELSGSAWESQGTIAPTLTTVAHTGEQALLMQGPGTATVSQTLTLPDDLEVDSLTLSWMALVGGTISAPDALTVEVVVDGVVNSDLGLLTGMAAGDWVHDYMSVEAQAGQAVTVRLSLAGASGVLLYLDEISLGDTRLGVDQIYLPLVLRNSQD